MSTGTFHSADDVRRSIQRLTEEQEILAKQREYLLSQAIPKLEHEYLYCINSLEQEAVKLEGELLRLSTIISFYESSLQKDVMPQQQEIAEKVGALSAIWTEQTKKFKYMNPEDQSVIPMLQYERDEIALLFHKILRHISKYSLHEGTDHYTYLLRRVSDSYRSGNIGELRALRIILEAKIHSFSELKRKRSLLQRTLDGVKYRFLILKNRLFYAKVDSEK